MRSGLSRSDLSALSEPAQRIVDASAGRRGAIPVNARVIASKHPDVKASARINLESGWRSPEALLRAPVPCGTLRTMPGFDDLPDWERLLAAERHLQRLVPGSVLVGGTAAALHAHHRRSFDGDHVVLDLRDRFEEVLGALEAAAGWHTERVQKPVLILGSMDGILTGIRQLRRTQPLETEEKEGIRLPTLAEMARIKAWMLATRHTVRDYLDTVVLFECLGEQRTETALKPFDTLYAQQNGASPLAEVAEQLAAARPSDLATVDLSSYRGLIAPWNSWEHILERARTWARLIARVAMETSP